MADGAVSTAQSNRYIVYLEPLLKGLVVPKLLYGEVVRKLAHVVEFAVLGGLIFGFLMPRAWRYGSENQRMALSLGVAAAIAGLDEWIQCSQPGRKGQLWDVALDALGALLGILLYRGIRYLRRRYARR